MKEKGIDFVIGVGEATRLTIAASGAAESLHLPDTDSAMARVPQLLRAGDSVLIKGSRVWRFERLVRTLRTHFGGSTKRLNVSAGETATGVPA
jgi:UDP-N-acetylmuramyl pentapeptide synthase